MALEAQQLAAQTTQASKVQLHRSARESKTLKKVRLKSMAQDLMERCVALQVAQVPEGTAMALRK